MRLFRLALVVSAVYAVSQTLVDPDLWGHVLFGRDIVANGGVHTIEPYSFTSDRPWINHEWLAEVLLFLAFSAGGSLGIVALKTGVIVTALALMSRALNALTRVKHDILIAIAVVVMHPRTLSARPQLFSVVLFAFLLYSLIAADRGNRRWLLAIPGCMVLWANLHGGFIVGLGVLFLWLMVRLLQGGNAKLKGVLVALGLLSVAATLVNPYGFGLWQFLWTTVGVSRDIADWQPMLLVSPFIWAPFIAAALVCAFIMVKARGHLDWAYKLIVIALFVGAMRLNRLDAFFGIAMVMLVGPAFSRSSGFLRVDASTTLPVPYRAAFLCLSTMLVLASMSYGVKAARCIEMPNAPEAATIEFLKTHAKGTRVLTSFGWGEYAIWHLGSDILVSMDGRRETVYSEDFVDAHFQFYRNAPDAPAFATRLGADFVWLPSDRPVTATLIKEGWHPVFRGPVSTILSRKPGQTVLDHQQNYDRCFPNP